MKSKNVIVLLLSLTLSLVANSMPSAERDIVVVTGVTPNVVSPFVLDSNYYTMQNQETLCEPVYVRTVEVIIAINVNVIEVEVTILPKCRDVDLRIKENIYKNITIRTSSSPIRSCTAHLHYDGGGGHGRPI